MMKSISGEKIKPQNKEVLLNGEFFKAFPFKSGKGKVALSLLLISTVLDSPRQNSIESKRNKKYKKSKDIKLS